VNGGAIALGHPVGASGARVTYYNGEIHELNAHEGVEVPPQTPHQIKNPTDREIEFLVISHPITKGDRVLTS